MMSVPATPNITKFFDTVEKILKEVYPTKCQIPDKALENANLMKKSG